MEQTLDELSIRFKKLTEFEISNLIRCNRNPCFTPRNDQVQIIEKAISYYNSNDKGILVLMCGVGKTLISLWITQQLNCNRCT